MNANDLEHATDIRDRIRKLDVFLDGYRGMPWLGDVHLQFGGYQCDITGQANEQLCNILDDERKFLLEGLAELGVELNDG